MPNSAPDRTTDRAALDADAMQLYNEMMERADAYTDAILAGADTFGADAAGVAGEALSV